VLLFVLLSLVFRPAAAQPRGAAFMCGIAGFVDPRGRLDEATLRAMSSSLAHRGPDADGHLLIQNDAFSLGFGHRRLSIIDLSPGANQPFTSDYGNHHVVFTGEIYN